jgi:hypothetical protein
MEPEGNFWDILTAILSFTGLILISITYLIPVVSAEIAKRKISVTINTIGGSVEEMLLNYWDGKILRLERPFFRLLILSFHTQNHKAYSVLHFSIRPTGEKHLYLISQTSTNYLPYC